MSRVLKRLDGEWNRLAGSPRARRALMRWKAIHPMLAGIGDFEELLTRRSDPDAAPELLAALAALAPTDELAARVLLKALVPGLISRSRRAGYDAPGALDDMISLAWERIRTYPSTRQGSVAGNVLLDVCKRYRKLREIDRPRKRHQRNWELNEATGDSDEALAERLTADASAEDRVLERAFVDDLCDLVSKGVISEPALQFIVQTRVLGLTVSELALRTGISRNTIASWRFRAERRLRDLRLAG